MVPRFFLQLDSFKQVQASVFQLTRAPGKKVVYLGSLLLVLGIFSMFYVRERRLWFWLKDTDHGTNVVMAMSSARKTLDFEKEFVQTRDAVGAALGAKLTEASDAAGASGKPGLPARRPHAHKIRPGKIMDLTQVSSSSSSPSRPAEVVRAARHSTSRSTTSGRF